MMSAESLVMSYRKIDNQRITRGTPNINVFYWSDDSSSGDDCKPIIKSHGKQKSNDKLESNITKYIKKKRDGR